MSETASATPKPVRVPTHPLLVQTPDIRHAVRRLRWFTASFRSEAAELAAATGTRYDIDDRRLAAAFVAWLQAFRRQHEEARGDRPGFALFAAGLMLRELVRQEPVRATSPANPDRTDPAHVWPEGYAYVAYCLTVFASVMQQDFAQAVAFHPDLSDGRIWSSFRENASGDPALAIAFLDHFSGADPNWAVPSLFSGRHPGPAMRLSAPG